MSISFYIERSWFASRQLTGFPVLSCSTASSWKERVSISWERDAPLWGQTTGFPVLSWFVSSSKIKFCSSREKRGWVVCSEQTTVGCSWCSSRQRTDFPVLSWSGFGFGWLDWELLDCWATSPSGCRTTSGSNCFHPVMFQGNLWRRTRWRIYFLVYDFSSSHPIQAFGIQISWECIVKDDDVRSCLIELQFFLLSKIDVDETWIALNFNVRRDNSICVPLIMMRNKDC